jgi:hypothetical protein
MWENAKRFHTVCLGAKAFSQHLTAGYLSTYSAISHGDSTKSATSMPFIGAATALRRKDRPYRVVNPSGWHCSDPCAMGGGHDQARWSRADILLSMTIF